VELTVLDWEAVAELEPVLVALVEKVLDSDAVAVDVAVEAIVVVTVELWDEVADIVADKLRVDVAVVV
jgi:hypothetical protein